MTPDIQFVTAFCFSLLEKNQMRSKIAALSLIPHVFFIQFKSHKLDGGCHKPNICVYRLNLTEMEQNDTNSIVKIFNLDIEIEHI